MAPISGNVFIGEFEAVDDEHGASANIDKNSDEIISRKIGIKVPENLNWSSKNETNCFVVVLSFKFV